MNQKLSLIFWILTVLFLAALVSRNGAFILLALPFLAFLWAALLEAPGEIHLDAAREVGVRRSFEGQPVQVRLRLTNSGSPIARLQVREALHPKARLVGGTLEGRFALTDREGIELEYTFQASRGCYNWETASLTASDPFGLFEIPLELRAEAQVLVLPKPLRLRRWGHRPRPTVQSSGPYLSRAPGTGIDFWGLREYRPGDPLRSINWRTTARRPGAFFSKVYEREEMADIGLLLDARAAAYPETEAADLYEYAVQAAAALAGHYLAAGNRVSMLVLSDRLVHVFPGYGKRQLARILDVLAGSAPGEIVTLETLGHFPARLFPPHSVIVLVSPLLQDDLRLLERLRAEGYQLLLVSPSAAQPVVLARSENAYGSLAGRAAALERAVLLRRMRRKGVQVVDWEVRQPLVKTLQSVRFLRR